MDVRGVCEGEAAADEDCLDDLKKGMVDVLVVWLLRVMVVLKR